VVLADLQGKGRRVRTVAIPVWVKQGINAWMTAAGVEDGKLLRAVTKGGKVKESMSGWAVWSVVEQSAKEEQPWIGIILCKSKDRLIVEYALKDATLPIGVSSYSVTPHVPNRLQGQLPSADQIASLLAGID
jgi:hypothetical protein